MLPVACTICCATLSYHPLWVPSVALLHVVLQHTAAHHATAILVLGKFGLVWFGPYFPKLETKLFSFWQNFPNPNPN